MHIRLPLLGMLLAVRSLFAFWVGNPADPTLKDVGIFFGKQREFSLRAAFLADDIFHETFHEEFITEPVEPSDIKLTTFAGVLTANLGSLLDIYGILGGSKLKIDDAMEIPRTFAWGAGAKAIIFHTENFFIGADIKYFTTDQKPNYFTIEEMPAIPLTPFFLKYREWQGAVSMAYRIGPFVPYAGLTYLEAKISPSISTGLIDIPNFGMSFEFESQSAINQQKLGGVAGFSLVCASMVSLSFEARFVNQSAVSGSIEIKF